MISVKIKIIAPLKNPFGKNDFKFEIEKNSTVQNLLDKLGYKEPHIKFIMPIVNNTLRRLDTRLQDNDDIILSVPMGGG